MLKKMIGALVISMLLTQTLGAQTIQFSKERQVDIDVEVSKGNTLVPLNTALQMMNLTGQWQQKTGSIKIMDQGNQLVLYLDQQKATMNGQAVKIAAASIQKGNEIYVPLRTIAEQFGYKMYSQKEGIGLYRSLTLADEELIDYWNEDMMCSYQGIVEAIHQGDYAGIPIQEVAAGIKPQIDKISLEMKKPGASQIVKVLGKEFMSLLQQAQQFYAMDFSNKQAVEKAYYRFKAKREYVAEEIYKIKRNSQDETMVITFYKDSIPEFDELKIRTAYDFQISIMKDFVNSINENHLKRQLCTGEIGSRLDTAIQFREKLKYWKTDLKSQEAEKVFDAYLQYADEVVNYFYEVEKALYCPENLNPQAAKNLSKAQSAMETAYKAYEQL